MSDKLSKEDRELFNQLMQNAKKMKQDTVLHQKQLKKTFINKASINNTKVQQENILNEFYFSDIFEPLLQDDPISYLRTDGDKNELKKLKRGFYEPEFFLDLHGLTRNEAKKEIAALITACLRVNAPCASIMYGHGKNILKKQVPMWLAQHPDILCFHQASKRLGGNAALLVLFEITYGNFDFNAF